MERTAGCLPKQAKDQVFDISLVHVNLSCKYTIIPIYVRSSVVETCIVICDLKEVVPLSHSHKSRAS
jgi:hypothetical protein